MDVIDERFAVYTVVVLLCSLIAALAGSLAAVVTFGMVAGFIELTYWVSGWAVQLGHSGTSR